MSNSSSQGTVASNRDQPRFTEAGAGNIVFLLQARPESELVHRLAEEFRVVTFDARNARDLANALVGAAQQLGVAKYSLIAESELASAAIAHTVESGDSIEALILIAPSSPSLDLPLERLTAPALVLFGTRDSEVTPEAGPTYARRIPRCFYTLVYDAGHDIGADRPETLHAVVRDFLEHREKFVITRETSVINP